MSPVIDIDALTGSPLSDLHALAHELEVENVRLLRRQDLITAILVAQGSSVDEARESASKAHEGPALRAIADDEPADEGQPGDEADSSAGVRLGSESDADGLPSRRVRSRRTRRDRSDGGERADRASRDRAGPEKPSRSGKPRREAKPPAKPEQPEVLRSFKGFIDIAVNRSGFIRESLFVQSDRDVSVSQSQIRRSDLRRGDQVEGMAREPRKDERFATLKQIEQINGAPATEGAEIRKRFEDLTPEFATSRLASQLDKNAPFGKGSRVLLAGSARLGTSQLLRGIAQRLRGQGLELRLVVVGARPEEAAELAAQDAVAALFDRLDDAASLVELALERAKRVAEAGGDAVLMIENLDLLAPALSRRVFASARKLSEGGSLTVIASAAEAGQFEAAATSVAHLANNSSLGKVRIDGGKSFTLRADLLR